VIEVKNLLTGDICYFFSSTHPVDAVIGAYAQEHKSGNTWQWDEKYRGLVQEGKWHYFLGYWGTRKEERNG
jgi:hypothetical protein